MPRINPEIVVWARETAGLTQEEAAKRLGFHDSSRSSAAEKLAAHRLSLLELARELESSKDHREVCREEITL